MHSQTWIINITNVKISTKFLPQLFGRAQKQIMLAPSCIFLLFLILQGLLFVDLETAYTEE